MFSKATLAQALLLVLILLDGYTTYGMSIAHLVREPNVIRATLFLLIRILLQPFE